MVPAASLESRKRELRQAMRGLPPPSRAQSLEACRRVASLPELVGVGCVALFASLPDEPSTHPLFEVLRGRQARCLLPRIAASNQLEFCELSHWEDLSAGRYGVLEPPAGSGAVSLSEAEVVVVPGMAFDEAGGRLGRGGGYYDRTLARVEYRFVVGLALEAKIVEQVPRGERDRLVDAVVTESRTLSRE